jgi:hypothetical protein
MKAKIVKFPKKFQRTTPLGVAIKLYTEEEIEMVLLCINIFGSRTDLFTKNDIRSADPYYTIDCMRSAQSSFLLSRDAKAIISRIMSNVTDVTPSRKGAIS